MKKFHIGKALLCLLLLSLLLLCTACGKKGPKEPDIDVQNITIGVKQLKDFSLVVQTGASEGLTEVVTALQNSLQSNLNAQLKVITDSSSAEPSSDTYEILIGNCNRKETNQLAKKLKIYDWGYLATGKKIVIYSNTEDGILDAVKHFTKHVVRQRDDSSEIFFDNNANKHLEIAIYDIDTLTLQGNDILDYTIVYQAKNQSSKMLANWLASKIKYTYGLAPTVMSDKTEASGKEILVGTTNRTDCTYTTQKIKSGTYLLGADDTYVCVRGADALGDYYAVHDLIDNMIGKPASNQKVKIKKTTREISWDDTLSSMTFNVYIGTPTEQREASVLQTIINYLPDTFGVQEADNYWITYLTKHLNGIYDYVGEGSDGETSGEINAVFYRKDRFKLIDAKTRWLSDTNYFVSRIPESSLNRTYTYALLLDKHTNKKFIAMDTHLEHTTSEARVKQAEYLIEFVKANAKYPIVLMGDFNGIPASKEMVTLKKNLDDAFEIAKKAEKKDTFHGGNGIGTAIFDYVLVSSKNIDVSTYQVITDKENGMYPSDHFPVYVEYNINK